MPEIELARSSHVPNSTFLASPIPDLWKGGLIVLIGSWTVTMPLVGYFVIHEMKLAKIYLYTKFEVSSFTRLKFR